MRFVCMSSDKWGKPLDEAEQRSFDTLAQAITWACSSNLRFIIIADKETGEVCFLRHDWIIPNRWWDEAGT